MCAIDAWIREQDNLQKLNDQRPKADLESSTEFQEELPLNQQSLHINSILVESTAKIETDIETSILKDDEYLEDTATIQSCITINSVPVPDRTPGVYKCPDPCKKICITIEQFTRHYKTLV